MSARVERFKASKESALNARLNVRLALNKKSNVILVKMAHFYWEKALAFQGALKISEQTLKNKSALK